MRGFQNDQMRLMGIVEKRTWGCIIRNMKVLQTIAVVLAGFLPGGLLLAAGDGIEPPVLEPHFSWLSLLYTVVGAAGIAVVAFKDAKRSHLD